MNLSTDWDTSNHQADSWLRRRFCRCRGIYRVPHRFLVVFDRGPALPLEILARPQRKFWFPIDDAIPGARQDARRGTVLRSSFLQGRRCEAPEIARTRPRRSCRPRPPVYAASISPRRVCVAKIIKPVVLGCRDRSGEVEFDIVAGRRIEAARGKEDGDVDAFVAHADEL